MMIKIANFFITSLLQVMLISPASNKHHDGGRDKVLPLFQTQITEILIIPPLAPPAPGFPAVLKGTFSSPPCHPAGFPRRQKDTISEVMRWRRSIGDGLARKTGPSAAGCSDTADLYEISRNI
jgi:hypothetical protein